jgi:deoxyadenosine/deoxycytidine kinase
LKPHIIVSGAIGAGKSTASSLLGERLEGGDNSRLDVYLENFSDNPYLERFYSEPSMWAYQSQRFFLLQTAEHHRACQLHGGVQDHSVREVHLGFDKLLLRNGTLTKDSFESLDHLYKELIKQLRPPNLVVFLEATVESLKARIDRRSRPYEQNLQVGFLEELNTAKRNVWKGYSGTAVIWFDTNLHDLTTDSGADALVSTVKSRLLNE